MNMTRRDALKTIAVGTASAFWVPNVGGLMAAPAQTLFDPVEIGGLRIKSRIFKAATSYDMADGALRAKMAGFDAIELHFCHNFMLSQFLTPYYNKRTDAYGGRIENRARLQFEILEAVRKSVGNEFPVFAKIHGRDYLDKYGMTLEEGIFLARGLVKRGITAIEISGGNLVNGVDTMPWRDGLDGEPGEQTYFAPDARAYDKALDVPLILTGGNRRVEIREKELNMTPDVVAFGFCRTLLSEPDLPNKWKKDPTVRPRCISCNECIVNYGTGPTECILG